MKEFLPKDLDRLLELNKEYPLASSPRRTQIEEEIIALVPKDLFPPTAELIEMNELQEALKNDLLDLINNAQGSDLESYYNRVDKLSQKINNYATKLGISIPQTTDINKTLQTLLQTKFPTN